MRRFIAVGGLAVAIVGGVAYIAVGAPLLFAMQPYRTPKQPIAFNHQVHVQRAGIDCAFCHRTAAHSATAGYPDVQQCMFCHQAVGIGNPEIENVRQAWTDQRTIEWERSHRMPDHVGFSHEAHVQAGIQCATCHGDVGSMHRVEKTRSLLMGDCVECHRQRGAPVECMSCHK